MKFYDVLFQKYWNAPSQCFSEKQPLDFPGDWKVEQLQYMQDLLHILHEEVDVQAPGFTEAEWESYPKSQLSPTLRVHKQVLRECYNLIIIYLIVNKDCSFLDWFPVKSCHVS